MLANGSSCARAEQCIRNSLGLAALLVVACTPAPATTTPTTRAPPFVAAPAAPAEAKPADTAIAEKPNAYPLPPPLPEPPVTLDAEVVFQVALDRWLEFYPLANDALILVDGGTRFAVLRDGPGAPRWREFPRLSRGRVPEGVVHIGGTWPTAAYATLVYPRLVEEEVRSRVFRWRGGAWRQIREDDDGDDAALVDEGDERLHPSVFDTLGSVGTQARFQAIRVTAWMDTSGEGMHWEINACLGISLDRRQRR